MHTSKWEPRQPVHPEAGKVGWYHAERKHTVKKQDKSESCKMAVELPSLNSEVGQGIEISTVIAWYVPREKRRLYPPTCEFAV